MTFDLTLSKRCASERVESVGGGAREQGRSTATHPELELLALKFIGTPRLILSPSLSLLEQLAPRWRALCGVKRSKALLTRESGRGCSV